MNIEEIINGTKTAAITGLATTMFAIPNQAEAQQVNLEVATGSEYSATDFTLKQKLPAGFALAFRDRDFKMEDKEAYASFLNLMYNVPGLDGKLKLLGQLMNQEDERYGFQASESLGPISGGVMATSSFQGWDPIINATLGADIDLGHGFGLRPSFEVYDQNGNLSGKDVNRQEYEMEVTYNRISLGFGIHDWDVVLREAEKSVLDMTKPVFTLEYSAKFR